VKKDTKPKSDEAKEVSPQKQQVAAPETVPEVKKKEASPDKSQQT